jgi:hypothetical protein
VECLSFNCAGLHLSLSPSAVWDRVFPLPPARSFLRAASAHLYGKKRGNGCSLALIKFLILTLPFIYIICAVRLANKLQKCTRAAARQTNKQGQSSRCCCCCCCGSHYKRVNEPFHQHKTVSRSVGRSDGIVCLRQGSE